MLSRSAIRTAARSVVATNAARALNRVVSISVSLIVRGVEDFDVQGVEGSLGCTQFNNNRKTNLSAGRLVIELMVT